MKAIILIIIIILNLEPHNTSKLYILLGESGLGKTTLIDSLFGSQMFASKTVLTVQGELEILLKLPMRIITTNPRELLY